MGNPGAALISVQKEAPMPLLGYLINPALQIEDVNGKPLTGGKVRVFRHGTTTPYITWKDFTGDRNPAEVVLDMKGMAVILAEAGQLYDVYCEDSSGVPQWSRLNVPVVSGGISITSSDGSVVITENTDGGIQGFDLSVAEDDASRLDWIRCTGSGKLPCSDTYKPTYADGTMEVGSVGVKLDAGKYYHITAHVQAVKSESATPWYDRVFVVLSQKFPSGPDTQITQQSFVVDGSMLLVQDFEVSCDTMVDSACELKIEIVGDLNNVTYSVTDLEVHRVYSGFARGGQFEQEQADWTETDTSDPSYIKHKPDLATVATTGDYYDLQNLPSIPADKVYIFWDFEFNRTAIRAAIAAHKVIMDWDRTSNEHRFFTKYEEKVIDGNLCELYHFAHIETDYNTPFATIWRLGDMCYIYDTVRQIQYAEHDTKLFNHEVPDPTSADAGKVLTASWNPEQAAGSWSWQSATTVGTITL